MPVKKQKSIIVFQDIFAFLTGFVLLFAFLIGSCWMLYLTTLPTSSSIVSVWISRVIFSFTGLCLPILYAIKPERYFVWYRFTSEHIICYTLLRQKKILSYEALSYVMYGKYMHGNLWREYIVFSGRKLSTAELTHINRVCTSSNLIKIRASKRNREILYSILPEKIRSKIFR